MTVGPTAAPIRVLHVIGGLKRGGVETWLLHLLRRANRSTLAMDFLVHARGRCDFDEEALSLGARIIHCRKGNPAAYLYAMRNPTPYDVVHCHLHAFSGWILFMAALAKVPVRIVHSHTDSRQQDGRAGVLRQLYLRAMRKLINAHATCGFAASSETGTALFGPTWAADPRWSIFRCGIDLRPFETASDGSLRDQLQIPKGAFVIGHVGRFVDIKNHSFLVAIAREMAAIDPAVHFLLIGDGPLRPRIEAETAAAGLGARVTFAGQLNNVPSIMASVMDAFVLPSLWEGLPLVVVEAQAAGLPCLISDKVSKESSVVADLFAQESIQASPETWARRLLDMRRLRTDRDRRRALSIVRNSPFEIQSNLASLRGAYFRLLGRE